MTKTNPAGVTHTVLVSWSADSQLRSQRASELVETHLNSIDGLTAIDHGISISTEGLERGFDWMLVIRFRDQGALDSYLPHAEHLVLANYLGANSDNIVVFDINQNVPR